MKAKRRFPQLGGTLGILCAIVWISSARGQNSQNAPDPVVMIQQAGNGLVDVAALDLPLDFLRHVADWDLRGHFRTTFRQVAPDPAPASAAPVEPATSNKPSVDPGVITKQTQLPRDVLEYWLRYPFGVPALRGFRAPVLDSSGDPWPWDVSAAADAVDYRQAATYVAGHLAKDGLIRTIMKVMRQSKLPWTRDGALRLAKLRAVGVPIDWLEQFTIDDKPAALALAAWFDSPNSATGDSIEPLVARAKFAFHPSCPGFKVMIEDGSEPLGMLRFQLPTEQYVHGSGDGSVLDVFNQLAEQSPQRSLCVSIHADGVAELLRRIHQWNLANPARITIVPNPANITQWAQDDGKAGRAGSRNNPFNQRTLTLVPRYASRSELRTESVPSDSLVFESLSRAGFQVVQSPLLFQGGNLMPVSDPKTGARILLIGEAEIHRNRALGLSRDQVIAAFIAEFGVDRCEVIPAMSFHIDLDFTVRRCGNDLVACMNDDVLGSGLIVQAGLAALQRAGIIEAQRARDMLTALSHNDVLGAVSGIDRAIAPLLDPQGVFNPRFTAAFLGSAPESGAINAMRFLVALDTLAAVYTPPKPSESAPPSPLRQYMDAIRRHEADRVKLAARLQQLGMLVRFVPGLSDHQVGVNYVNGINLPDAFMMPACGGTYAALDEAAQRELANAFGPNVQIKPIRAAAMQANDGGLHCLVGMYPAAPGD